MIHGLEGEPLAIPVGTDGALALVDEEDFWVLAEYDWHATQRGHVFTTIENRPVYMHRLVARTPADRWTDHINGNPLDNRRENLRICTPAENNRNRRKFRMTSAGCAPKSTYKGVSCHADIGWAAAIRADGHQTTLGYFDDEIAAAKAYDEAARQHFGVFARLNFPRAGEQSALDLTQVAA